jgi:hypothetical protein
MEEISTMGVHDVLAPQREATNWPPEEMTPKAVSQTFDLLHFKLEILCDLKPYCRQNGHRKTA